MKRRFAECILLLFALTSNLSFASNPPDQCAPRKFAEIVSKSKKAISLDPYSAYFYEPETKIAGNYPRAFAFLNGKLYVDTRGGDLYSSKFKYDEKTKGFRVERILYATYIEKKSILFPKYNQSCSEIEALVFVSSDDDHEKINPVSIEYRRKKKCHISITADSYGWADCHENSE